MEGSAEELDETFWENFNLSPFNPSKYYTELLQKLPSEDRTETLLSFVFQSAATMDYVRFEEFKPSKDFADKIKSIAKEILNLLHVKRGWRNEDE